MVPHIRSEYSGRIATVILDRPERRNAISAELMRQMIACAGELQSRDDIDAVIVTGAAGCFSAGADLKDGSRWAGGAPLLAQREIAGLGHRMARAWEELPQITVAAIEGYAVGGGLALAVALDWRVMARDAFVSLPEISLGIPLTWGTLPRLVNLVGPAKAKRLSILCERIGADAALDMGLVDELCDKSMAVQVARRLAESALESPRHSVRMTKEAVNAYAGIGAHAVSYMAHDQLELAAASPESRAARDQALKRRKR
ncbi:MAG TPA: enoyl-CoA hydratase/isomerase family protein [Burkholderiales bacterium]